MTTDSPIARLAELPLALLPVYSTPAVNQAITLYEGPLEIHQGSLVGHGIGVVRYEWLPSPAVKFDLSLSRGIGFKLEPASISFPPDGPTVDVHVFSLPMSFQDGVFADSASGRPQQPIVRESGQDATLVTFHLTNFTDFWGLPIRSPNAHKSWVGRAVLEAGPWKITIDLLDQFTDFKESLGASGGFGVTHAGQLQRNDGKPFAKPDTDDVWQLLFCFLSFVRGAWSAPILPVAFDASGNRVWEEWAAWRTTAWRDHESWFSGHKAESMAQAFPGFFRLWQDPRWAEALSISIHQYIDSNRQAGAIEGSIVLEQTALELLGWVSLVELRHIFSRRAFKELKAAGQIRTFLADCGIPVAIPASMLPELAKLAVAMNWADGPQALAGLRNMIVHPEPPNRKALYTSSKMARFEAWKLGLWYLELALLRLVDYQGEYFNRLRQNRWHGELEPVPWVTH